MAKDQEKKREVKCHEIYIGPWTNNVYECTLLDEHEGYHYDEHQQFDWNIKKINRMPSP